MFFLYFNYTIFQVKMQFFYISSKNLIENKMKAEQMILFGNGFEEENEEEVEILSENESKVLELLKNMDLNSISPLESLLKLSEVKKILVGGTDD